MTASPNSFRDSFREDARFRVLRLLEANSELTQREISDALGISLGAVNFCLRALVERGAVKVENFRTSRNKLAYGYLLTPRGLSEKARLTRGFLERRMSEYAALRAEIEALSTGGVGVGGVEGGAGVAGGAGGGDFGVSRREE